MFHKYDKQDVENPCVPNSYPIAQSQLSWSTYQNSKYKLLMLLGKLDKKVLIHGHHDKTSCVTASVQNLVSKCTVTCLALLLKAAVHTLNRLLICCDESTVANGCARRRTLGLQHRSYVNITARVNIQDERIKKNCCSRWSDPLFNKSNYHTGIVVISSNDSTSVYNLVDGAATTKFSSSYKTLGKTAVAFVANSISYCFPNIFFHLSRLPRMHLLYKR